MKAQEKKRLIKSYQNLPEEARELFDIKYGEGYANAAQKITKPDGSLLYVVPLETDDAVYMVKVDVVIDSKFSEEEFDKEILGPSKNDDEIVGSAGDEEEDEVQGKDKFVLVHGDYSEVDDVEDDTNDEPED
ncbi:MAG: hypothetical protein U0K83_00880 [Bacteroidales bacterium]|jgi:hypothetical protein|nr:hypothetical protein [Bacteroidales bacterium]